MDFKSTLNLPNPDFTIPMKADLPRLEPQIQSIWDETDVYRRIQNARQGAPSFVLHDGPPYTNSPIHIGTALNKVLKDFVIKSRTMMGFHCPYVPGYDTHGLPIEQAVTKKLKEKKIEVTGKELRAACREHVAEFIAIQTTQFKRLGVLGLWNRPYATLDFKFEAEIVRVFKRLVEDGYVYRGLRPTQWSPTLRTALADTEIEYHDHVSKAIYVRFPLLEDPNRLFEKYTNVYTIIWTTTPWTIPANLAVAFHPEFDYALVRIGDDFYLVLEALVEKLTEKLGWVNPVVVERMVGVNFENMKFKHPIFDRPSIAVHADYVTTEDGTGVVHTAPSHGRDDFYTGQKYGLPVPNSVDEGGVLTAEAGEFAGVHFRKCDTVVVDRLQEVGNLLLAEDYSHSYPYAERDTQPVIFRATNQWFLNLSHLDLRAKLLSEIENVQWFPPTGQNRIEAMIGGSPDWCISRQRPWGVGIPVFYGKDSGQPVLDPVIIELIAEKVQEEGSGAWFEHSPEELLPKGYVHPQTGETDFTKETDVLDVWFDSGSTSFVVLLQQVFDEWKAEGLTWPADLYLEGSDQHRGWFNKSLILSTATLGGAPFKQVLTHGFVTDGEGRKMSKRLGNVVEPVDAANLYGADILRYWVASVNWQNDVPCSDALLKQFGDSYRTVRNTLRFLLSNLYDFDPSEHSVSLNDLDEWIVEQTDLLVAECVENYAQYEFGAVINAIHNFCAKELSKFYLDAIKDRMYCDRADSMSRRAGQTACYLVLCQLVKLVAPILAHTAEETWLRIPGVSAEDTVHAAMFGTPSEERLAAIEASPLQTKFAILKSVRDEVFASFETWKAQSGVKNSQDVSATLCLSGDAYKTIADIDPYERANYFKMSWVDLVEDDGPAIFKPSTFAECERSRVRRPDVSPVTVDGVEHMLSNRDREALGI